MSAVSRPARNEAAIIADVRGAVREIGIGFDSSSTDLERVAAEHIY